MLLLKNRFKRKIFTIPIFILVGMFMSVLPACRNYDEKFDVIYFFKTGPEKAVLDFFGSLNSKDPEVIYTNGEIKHYKKYIYLTEESNKWKVIFEKTFI